MNIRKQAGYLGVGGKRVIGGLGSNTALDAYIRSLGPAAWFRMDQGVTVTGAGISQVDDLSGNARHLLDPGTTRPIYLPYSGTKYLYLPGVVGNYASTPDSVANSITGDIDIRVRVSLDDWTPGASHAFMTKYGGAGQRSFIFYIASTGALRLAIIADGTSAVIDAASTSATGLTDGATKWVRVTVDVDNGSGGADIKFWLSDDGESWTQLGTTVTHASTLSFFDSTTALGVGGPNFIATPGKIYRAIIKNGIDGTTVVDFNPADADGDGDTSFASSTTGETWTINSSGSLPAQIVGRASALFNGTSHYLKTNAFTLNQPTCVLFVVKQVSWTNNENIFDGNAANSSVFYQSGVTPQLRMYAGGAGSIGPASSTIGAVVVASVLFSGADSFMAINGGTKVTGNPGTNNMGGLTVGAGPAGGSRFANIQVYEVAIFPFAPSTAQLDRLIAGLMARHGVA